MAYRVTVIPGDGIGPEVIGSTLRVLESLGISFEWEVAPAGQVALETHGDPLPPTTVEAMKRNRVTIKGPTATPVGSGFRSVNVVMRKELEAFANVRPARTLPGIKTRHDAVNIVLIRETLEDLYAGIEADLGTEEALELREWLNTRLHAIVPPDSAFSIKFISRANSERIIDYAFRFARKHRRSKVTAVHKANIMKATDGLFLEIFRTVASRYSDVQSEDLIVDNASMQLVMRPERFDVLVCPNLYGDILSDLCAGLVGGLGIAPGANIGDEYAIFEAVHGTAPDIAGKDLANPTAMFLTAKMMLDHLGEEAAADCLEKAVLAVLSEGKYVTRDINPLSGVGTSAMTNAVKENLSRF